MLRYPRRDSAALALLALAAACTPADDETTIQTTTRRDSAGVTVVENHAPRWGRSPRWTVDSVPLFAPSSADDAPAPIFTRLLNVYRLADGTVVTLDGSAPFVRAFDASGRPRWSAVARGDGPGELRRPAVLSRIRGDSLVVDDGASPRALLLAPDGT
ncbi:MAG TPA: hypothetical protein VFS08_06375, partial [Gemmatimonadaceae bacterium]|nr:hypothetical protein [Gemmatimonadaceae bacterium]